MPKKRVKLPECLNCETALQEAENFCPTCGQENHQINRPLTQLWKELLEGILNIDSRFFHTVKSLFTKPGKLTKDFNEGKRRYHLPPIRIYLFASLMFFLFQSIEKEFSIDTDQAIKESFVKNPADSTKLNLGFNAIQLTNQEVIDLAYMEPEQLDSFLIRQEMVPNFFNRKIVQQGSRVINGNTRALFDQFYHFISLAMFFLMPLFGWLLFLFYKKQKKFFIEHLIFSVHYHSTAFLLLTLVSLATFLPKGFPNISPLFEFGVFIYLLISLKNVYQEPWGKTVLKFLGLLFIYGFCCLIALAIIAVLAVLFF